MATREYVVGKYEEYYNSLKGEVSASSKASDFISEVSRLCTEFDNVTQIMTYWEGEAKSAMCADGISSVMEKFKSTQANLNDALAPVCDAIGVLSDSLDKMKTTEDTWLQKKSDLSSLKNKEPSQTKSDGSTNPEYSSWKSNYDKLNSEIDSLKKELDGLKAVCDDSIAKIESLEGSLREFSDYMEMTNSILGIGSTDFSSYSLEQRLTYLQELIDNYQTIYDSLNEVYQQRYGHGFKYTAADFKQLDFLFDAFDLYWMSKVDRKNVVKSENGGLVVFDIDNLIKVLSYCNANDVFTKIESYMNGASWEKSGLDSLYSGQFLDTDSANFMNTQAFNESRFKKRLKENYGVTGDPREYLKKNFDSIVSSYEKMMNAYGEYQKLAGAMAAVRCQIDSVKEAKKLMPYEMNMEKTDFKSYLSKDYSGYSLLSQEQLSVMSQQEVALYDYLYHTKSKKEAEAYLKAMENTMNQRIGAYRATEYVEYLRQGGYGIDDLLVTGWEGLKDGVSNFFDGIADLFRVSSTEAGTKTAFDYEMMYKVQFMTELMNDPTYVKPGTSKKTFGFGDLTNWYNTGTSVGNMVVPSIVSFIPVVGKPLSTSLMTLSIAGNSAVQAKQEGYSTAQAYIYGALSGASETFTEVTLGGIPGISNLEGKGVLGSMFSEGLEEFTQEYLDVGLRWIVLGEEPESGAAAAHERFANAFRAGAQGFITSGVMQGGNTVMGLGVNTVTRALSPTVTTSNGDVIKKYNSYGEFKNGVESNFYTPRAASAINDAVTRTANGESLSLTDKIKLNRAISNVSAEELSNITHDLSTEQRTALNDALSGIPKMSNSSSEKIDNAAVLASAAEATDISNISGLTEDSLNATVTRDGRSLAQYLADNKAGMMNENAIRTIEEISPEAASEIVSRMEANQKAYEKKMAKAQKHGAPNSDDIASVVSQYENATQHTQTSAQQTNNSGVNEQANVQQKSDASGAVNDSASGSSSYVESYPTQTGGSSEYFESQQTQSNTGNQAGSVRTSSPTFDSNAQQAAQQASYSAAVQQSTHQNSQTTTQNRSSVAVQQGSHTSIQSSSNNSTVATNSKVSTSQTTRNNVSAEQNQTNKSNNGQTETSVEHASEVIDTKTETQESDAKASSNNATVTQTSEKTETKGRTYDTVSQGIAQQASYGVAVQQSTRQNSQNNTTNIVNQTSQQVTSTNKSETTDAVKKADTVIEQNSGKTSSQETVDSMSSESSTEKSDSKTKVASAAAPATLGWQYTLQNNSNAGKKGTVININMDLINKSLTPDGNLKVAETNWNAAGKPKNGQVYEAYQSAYAYAHMAGGTNTSSISQLHQQDGNINYNTSTFRSSTTTKQGMSPSDFKNLVQNGVLSTSIMVGTNASIAVDNSTNNSNVTDSSQTNQTIIETQDKKVTTEESETELTEKIADSIDLQQVGEQVLERINSGDFSSETGDVDTQTEDDTLEASKIASAIDFEAIADDLLNQLNSKKSTSEVDSSQDTQTAAVEEDVNPSVEVEENADTVTESEATDAVQTVETDAETKVTEATEITETQDIQTAAVEEDVTPSVEVEESADTVTESETSDVVQTVETDAETKVTEASKVVNPFVDTEVESDIATESEATDAQVAETSDKVDTKLGQVQTTVDSKVASTTTDTGINITDSLISQTNQTMTGVDTVNVNSSIDTLSTLTEFTPAQVLDVLNTLPDSSIKDAIIKYISNSSNLISASTVQQIQELCNMSAEFALALHNETGMTFEKFVEQCKKPISAYSTTYDYYKTEANNLIKRVKSAEPTITTLLQSLAVNGAELVGLEHRFKTFDGIFKKMINTNSSFINDALRYTMILDPKTYSADVVSKLETLYDAGYKIDYINNSWGNSKYQGLNVGLVTPEGLVIELQFHTKESFAVKEFMSHDYYDIAKSTNTPYSLVKQANAIMELAQSTFNSNVPSNAVVLSKGYIESNFAHYAEFSSYDEFVKVYGKQAEIWFKSLDPSVQSLFYHYVGESDSSVGGYKTLNGILRDIFLSKDGKTIHIRGTSGYSEVYSVSKFESLLSGKMTVQDFIKESIKAAKIMTQAAGTNTFVENTKIYRGINFDALAKYGIDPNDSPSVIYQKLISQGQFYHDDGFMSSSPSPGYITNGKPIILEIKALKGTSFIDLNYINSGEREILFPPGSSFHIDGVSKDSHGKIIIHLKSVVNSAATQTSTVKAPVSIPMPNLGSLINVHNDYANGFQYSIYDSSFAILEESVANHSVQEIYTEVSNEYINCDITSNAIIATIDKMISENSPQTNKYIASVVPVLIASGDVDYLSELKSKLSPAAVTEIPSLMSTFDLKAANTFDAIPMKQTPDNENLIKSASHYKTLLAIETAAELYEDLVKKLNNNETSIENIEQIVDHLFENEYKEDFLAAVIPIMISKGNIPFLTSVKALLSDSQIKQINKHMNKISSSAVSFFDSLEPAPLVFGMPLPTFLKSVQNENVFNLYEKVQNGLANSTITIEQCKIAADAMLENGSPSTTDFFAAIIPTLIQNGDTAYIAEFKGKLGDMQSTFTGLALTFISPDDVSVFDSITPVESNQESNTGSVVDNQSNDTHLSDATSSEYVTTFNDTISVNKDGVSEIDFEALDNLINANTQYTLYQLISDDIFFCSASDILKAVEGLIAENSPETIKFTSAAVPALVEYGQTEVVEKIKNIFSAEQQAVLVQEIAKISEDASKTFANLGNTQSVANTIATATGKTIDIAEYEKAISEYTQKELYESTKTDLLFGSTTADEMIQVIDGLNAKNSPETIKYASAVIPVLVEYGQIDTLESIKSIFSTEQQAILVQEIAKISEDASQTFANLGNPQATVVSDTTATQEEYEPLDFDTIVSAYESQDADVNTQDSPAEIDYTKVIKETEKTVKDMTTAELSEGFKYQILNGLTTLTNIENLANAVVEQGSEEIVKIISSTIPILYEFGETEFLTEMKDKLTVEEQAEIIAEVETVSHEASQAFANLTTSENAIDSQAADVAESTTTVSDGVTPNLFSDVDQGTVDQTDVKEDSKAVAEETTSDFFGLPMDQKSQASTTTVPVGVTPDFFGALPQEGATPVVKATTMIDDAFSTPEFVGDIDAIMAEASSKSNMLLHIEIEKSIKNGVHSIEYYKALVDTLIEQDVANKEKYIASVIPSLFDANEIQYLEQLKSQLSVSEEVLVNKGLDKISVDYSDQFFDLNSNPMSDEVKRQQRIVKTLAPLSINQMSETMNNTVKENINELKTYKNIIETMINEKSGDVTKFVTAIIPTLVQYGDIGYLQFIKSQLEVGEHLIIQESLAGISPSIEQTFSEIKVLDAEVLEIDKLIRDGNLIPSIGNAKLNHKDIMPTINRYLEESVNQKNKQTVIKTLLILNQDSKIDFTKYLSARDCVSILETIYSDDVNMQFTNVDELNRFMGLVENNETLITEILNQGVSYDLLTDLLSEMDCYEVEEITNDDGSTGEKYIFKLNGLTPKAMQNIGEAMIGNDSSTTYEFETKNGVFTREQLTMLLGEYKTYRSYTDYSDFEAKYKQLIDKWEKSLSFDERVLFEVYSSQSETKVGGYKTLNGILRGTAISPDGQTITVTDTYNKPKTYTNDEWFNLTNMTIQEFQMKSFEAAEVMAKAIAKVQLLENTEIIRGVTFDSLAKFGVLETDTAEQIYQKITANGHFYQDDGFMSSSPTPGEITSSKDVQLVLHCDTGTPFADLTMSKLNSNYNEHEVLLAPGVKLHIDSVVQIGNKTYIHMTTISNTSTSVSQMANPVSPFSDDYTGTDAAAPAVAPTYDTHISPFSDDYTGTDTTAPAVTTTYDSHVSPFSDDYTGTDADVPTVTPKYDTHVSPFSDDYTGTDIASLSETTEELVLDTTGNVKNSDLYINAPFEFTTAVDGLFKYANSILGTPSCHAKIAAAFMKHLDYVASLSTFPDAKYYAFISLNCDAIPAGDYSKAILQLINADQNLRELISEKALDEITKAFGPLYGITDTKTFEELRDCLLGDRFIQDGLGQGSNWDRFIEIVTEPMLVATQNSVNNKKEPVIWSGFKDEYHAEMDMVFTTIGNTSIAGVDFVENVYTDWYGTTTPYSVSKLWADLSVAYANACSTVINPATGQVYDSIKFLYPLGKNVTDMFGELFKSSELPTIVANGTIKTITLSATDPGTMKVLSTVDVDITELIDFYNKYSVPGVEDKAINEKLFEMFYEKVKEVM